MRIALDATPLETPTGGIRRYLSELTEALKRTCTGDDFVLLTDQTSPRPPAARRWWSLGLPLELLRRRVDVFHGVDFAVPYLPVCASVMTLHDLSPWMNRNAFHAAERVRRRTPALVRLGLATMLVTPSEAVRRHAIDALLIPPTRIVSIPLAAGAHFQPAETNRCATPYFLFVGTLEPRKNLETIVAAWHEVRRDREVDLVLAGRRRDDFAAPPPAPGLVLAGAVPEAELPGLYSGAAAFLFPSHYEGFGLPVLEAMQCGAPVITSRDPALREVAGDAAVRLDAREPRAWAEAMRATLDRPEWRAGLCRRSLDRAREFSWEETARRTREIYDDALRRFGG